MEGDRQAGQLASAAFGPRLLAAALAGSLLAGLATVLAGALVRWSGVPGAIESLSGFVGSGGWLALILWGAGAGLLAALRWARTARERAASLVGSALVVALGTAFLGSMSPISSERTPPRTARAKSRAVLRWSFRSPQTVARILPYARDPNPVVREQAVLALGVNLIVSDIQRASGHRPSRFLEHPLRPRIRDALLVALEDSVEAVRAEAARALWKAPRAFGPQPQAAETLAAVLDRARLPGRLERLAWLALDAAAGTPDAELKAAAARFAAATPESDLARVARRAASSAPEESGNAGGRNR